MCCYPSRISVQVGKPTPDEEYLTYGPNKWQFLDALQVGAFCAPVLFNYLIFVLSFFSSLSLNGVYIQLHVSAPFHLVSIKQTLSNSFFLCGLASSLPNTHIRVRFKVQSLLASSS